MIKRIWKSVPAFEGIYEVSNYGEIRSLPRIVSEINDGKLCRYSIKGKIVNLNLAGRGHLQVVLRNKDTKKYEYVHRLVALAFIGLPEGERKLVNHKDGNKINNMVENLEWVTYSENMRHAYATGLRKGFWRQIP